MNLREVCGFPQQFTRVHRCDFCTIPDPRDTEHGTARKWVGTVARTYFHKHKPRDPAPVLLFSKMDFSFLCHSCEVLTQLAEDQWFGTLRNTCLSRKKTVFLGKVGGSLTVDSHRLRNHPTSKAVLVLLRSLWLLLLRQKRNCRHNYVKNLDGEMVRWFWFFR